LPSIPDKNYFAEIPYSSMYAANSSSPALFFEATTRQDRQARDIAVSGINNDGSTKPSSIALYPNDIANSRHDFTLAVVDKTVNIATNA
jgi:hypothetical protein